MLGADGVQIGTGYLLCTEATIGAVHRGALEAQGCDRTALTNVFTGRPARSVVNRFMSELGPLSSIAPEFPLAGNELGPLRAKAESMGSRDFTPLWAGQAARLARPLPAATLTRALASETEEYLAAVATRLTSHRA